MYQLSKPQSDAHQALVANLEIAETALGVAIADYNDQAQTLFEQVIGPALQRYNDAMSEAMAFRDDIVEQQRDYAEKRSDKWHASEKGEAYQEWMAAWRCADIDYLDLDLRPFGLPVDEGEDLPSQAAVSGLPDTPDYDDEA